MAGVGDSARYDLFDLTDAAIAGDRARTESPTSMPIWPRSAPARAPRRG
jgi:hypothetical protein